MEGVEEGLPDEADALSRLFEKDSKLMIIPNMKKLFRFLKNIGLDRSPSFSGPKIKINRISSTRNDSGRIIESFFRMNLRLQQTICNDESLPAINPTMKNELAAEEAEAAKNQGQKTTGRREKSGSVTNEEEDPF